MPRRYVDYLDAQGLWNAISTWGAYITFASTDVLRHLPIYTVIAGRRVGDNYWGEEDDHAGMDGKLTATIPHL